MSKQFWMVWCPTRNPPTYRHDTVAAAETEAERLAKLNPGDHFVILEAVGIRVVDNMQRIDLRQPRDFDDDLPF